MSSEQNKVIVRRIPLEIYNQGNMGVADEVVSPDYVEHAPLPPGFPTGIQGLQLFAQAIRGAFPDFHYTIDDEIADGDKVVVRLTAHGTNQGEFMGMPATGKQATWSEIHVARLVDGKLMEHWTVIDQLGMLQQLGVIPTPGQAGE